MSSDTHARLREYLSQMAIFMRSFRPPGSKYVGMEDFVLHEGRAMQPPAVNPKVRKRTAKECFRNSTNYVIEHRDHKYVEGYILSDDLPVTIHHAWTLHPEGHVIDPTLGWRPDTAYFGVEFELKDVLRRIRASGYYGLFSDGLGLHDLVLGSDPGFSYKYLRARALAELTAESQALGLYDDQKTG